VSHSLKLNEKKDSGLLLLLFTLAVLCEELEKKLVFHLFWRCTFSLFLYGSYVRHYSEVKEEAKWWKATHPRLRMKGTCDTPRVAVYAIDNSALHSQSHEVFLHLFIYSSWYTLRPAPQFNLIRILFLNKETIKVQWHYEFNRKKKRNAWVERVGEWLAWKVVYNRNWNLP